MRCSLDCVFFDNHKTFAIFRMSLYDDWADVKLSMDFDVAQKAGKKSNLKTLY